MENFINCLKSLIYQGLWLFCDSETFLKKLCRKISSGFLDHIFIKDAGKTPKKRPAE